MYRERARSRIAVKRRFARCAPPAEAGATHRRREPAARQAWCWIEPEELVYGAGARTVRERSGSGTNSIVYPARRAAFS